MIELIRRNSKKLKHKLSKKHSGNQLATVSNDSSMSESVSIPNLSGLLKRNSVKSRSTVSFDMPAYDQYNPHITDYPHEQLSKHYRLSNIELQQQQQQQHYNDRRNSVDHFGTVVDIRKQRGLSQSPPPTRKTNRRSLDERVLMQPKRVFSDGSVTSTQARSKTRPQSLIVDDMKFIPEYRTQFYQLSPTQAKSTSSLTTLLKTNPHGIDFQPRRAHKMRHSNTIAASDYNALQYTNKVKNNTNIKNTKNKRKQVDQFIPPQHVNIDTIPDILLSLAFQTFNIMFSICFYLPIYIVTRFSLLSILVLVVSTIVWYTNGWIWTLVPDMTSENI